MRGVIKVVTQEEFDMEMAKLKPQYFAAFPDKDPATKQEAAPVADTVTAVVVAEGNAVASK